MTKLPARNLLDGTKSPETTTGEFRLAMGNLRQYLAELFGDESSDKETARQTLGIDLAELKSDISKKADQQAIETALTDKADITELSGVAFTGNYNDLINIPDAIPAGFIGMWSGATIPDGWALCNGENGTPDLRDKFVVGAGSRVVGTTGGETSASISGTTGATTLTVDQMPSHSHMIAGYSEVTGSSNMEIVPLSTSGLNAYGSRWTQAYSRASGGGGFHSHSLSGSVSTLPQFYALAFIMKL